MDRHTTREREKIRWLALLIIIAVFSVLAWIFGWTQDNAPVLFSSVW